MDKITFEQLPQAVSLLIEKVGQLADKVDLDDVAALLGKSASTIYAMTSEKRIPYHKRGNKLYFFEDEIIGWIEQGGTSGTGSEEDFNRRLEALRGGKKHKPSSLQTKQEL